MALKMFLSTNIPNTEASVPVSFLLPSSPLKLTLKNRVQSITIQSARNEELQISFQT